MKRQYALAATAVFILGACDGMTDLDPNRTTEAVSRAGTSQPAADTDLAQGFSSQPKVALCHRRPNYQWNLIEVGEAAAESHLAHGDTEPPCAPTLLEPIEGQLIPQNNPATGCPVHPFRGQGIRILFDWTDSLSPVEIAGYELYARHAGSTLPIENRFVAASEFDSSRCSFVIDSNLLNWEWKVRGRDVEGRYGPWSEIGEFGFEPCRLENGLPCSPREP
ncbi:MAG: hypothetical protein ABFS14_10130 [Gemmatimonadota bacterium]